ncbi:sulfatase [Candidatus Epulonipiscioides gigas]|nr:sulfatase [Epulopiscium sp. SCG-C07WGA-EpuloA2]
MSPNILFIMTDQQRFDTFGLNNDLIITPNLDKLIEESVFFENAYCSNPSCIPSRAAMMTGKMPSECGCPTFKTRLPQTEKTFVSMLQENGYFTELVGKLHFAESKIDTGFDKEILVDGHAVGYKSNLMGEYLKYLAQNKVAPNQLYRKTSMSGGEWLVDTKFHIDYFLGEKGKQEIKNLAKDKPWFLNLSFSGPHHPYDLDGTKYANMYKLEDMTIPEAKYEHLNQKPKHFKEMDSYANIYLKDYTLEQYQKSKRSYYATLTLIDEKIGKIIKVLKEEELYDNTIIIFTSDHGDFMGDFGMMEKLQCLTDSLMRVPLFIKPPIKDYKGKKVKDKVLNIDVAATCLEVAQIQIPKDISNYGYTQYYTGNHIKERQYIFMEAGDIKGVINDNIKTVSYINRDYGELYDLNKDPLEINNLWDDENYTAQKMQGLQLIINEMYKSIPYSDVIWNDGTPFI